MRYLLQHRVRGTDPWESGWSLSCSIEGAKGDIDYTRYPNTEYRVLELRDVGNIFFEVWRTPKDEWKRRWFNFYDDEHSGATFASEIDAKNAAKCTGRPLLRTVTLECSRTTGQVRLVPEDGCPKCPRC